MMNLGVSKVLGILQNELKMRIRTLLYWIVLLVVNVSSLTMPTPLNYRSPEDTQLFPHDWWRAGEAVTGLSFFMILLTVILVANRILRDRDLYTKEIIQSRPVTPIEYVLGKYLGSFTSIALIALPSLFGTILIKWVLLESFMNPLPMVLALTTMYFPQIAFTIAFSLVMATLLNNNFVTYVLFAAFWYLESKFIDISSPIWGIFNNLGFSPHFAFFSAGALGLADVGTTTSAKIAVLNVITLLLMSALLLILLVHIEKRRWGETT